MILKFQDSDLNWQIISVGSNFKFRKFPIPLASHHPNWEFYDDGIALNYDTEQFLYMELRNFEFEIQNPDMFAPIHEMKQAIQEVSHTFDDKRDMDELLDIVAKTLEPYVYGDAYLAKKCNPDCHVTSYPVSGVRPKGHVRIQFRDGQGKPQVILTEGSAFLLSGEGSTLEVLQR